MEKNIKSGLREQAFFDVFFLHLWALSHMIWIASKEKLICQNVMSRIILERFLLIFLLFQLFLHTLGWYRLVATIFWVVI